MKSETILGGLGVRGPGPASRWAMEAIIRYVPWWLEAMFEEAEMWRKIAMQGEGNAGDAGRPASRVGVEALAKLRPDRVDTIWECWRQGKLTAPFAKRALEHEETLALTQALAEREARQGAELAGSGTGAVRAGAKPARRAEVGEGGS
jgi:hypothetical protein